MEISMIKLASAWLAVLCFASTTMAQTKNIEIKIIQTSDVPAHFYPYEIIERHPDAVVVVTTNISYEGCRGMNQSVLDRMSLVRDVELPEPEVMVQRAMSVTGATDEYQVSQMVQVVNDMAEYCRKNSITDGSYGMRSLIDWIISTEITGDVYHSALYTIISKATADEMDREALISTVLEPIFAPPRKKAAV